MTNGSPYRDPYGEGQTFGGQSDEIQRMFGGDQSKWEAARAGQWFQDIGGAQEQRGIFEEKDPWREKWALGNQGLPSLEEEMAATVPRGTMYAPGGGYSKQRALEEQKGIFREKVWPPNKPSGGGGGGGGGGPVAPTDPSANSALWSSPMPGYIQFTPGGAVFPMVDEYGNKVLDPAYVQARQHLIEPVGGMEWSRRFGYVDPAAGDLPYIPDTGALTAYGMGGGQTPADLARRQQEWYAARQAQLPHLGGPQGYYTPSEFDMANKMYIEEETRRQAEQQQQIMDYLGMGGGTFGQGTYTQDYYNPDYYNPDYYGQQYTGGIPPAETSTYPAANIITGEPSFAGDPTPSDPFIDLADAGLGALASSAPAGTRDRLRSWLAGLGYTPQGVFGGYGETSWQRPEGQEGPAAFTDADFNTLSDPIMQQWIRWLMGKMGYSAPTLFPGAVAP